MSEHNQDDLWTAEVHTAEHIGIPISGHSAPCAVAPRNNPTADTPMPFTTGFLPDGRRAIPFLYDWEAQDIAARANSTDFWKDPR